MLDSEFTALFNGKDLAGWKVVDFGRKELTNRWRISNAAIAGNALKGEDHPPLNLVNGREFSEYFVRFEFRKTREPARCNFSYYLAGGAHHAVTLMQEVQPDGLAPGAIRYTSGKIRYPLDHAPLKDLNQWNQVEVDIRNDEVLVVINGVAVQRAGSRAGEKSDIEERNKRKPGRIGFTVFDGEIEFRKIDVRDR